MPLHYKVTNCHSNWCYRRFSLTNHLLSPSYFCTNLNNIGDKQMYQALQICQKPDGVYAICIVEKGRRLNLPKRSETMSCNTLKLLFFLQRSS